MATTHRKLARFLDALNDAAHSYAVDYLAWWEEGGREPQVDAYVNDDDSPMDRDRACEIAAWIRAEVKG